MSAPSLKPPRIGITLDYETAPAFSRRPWYGVRENYCTSVSSLGALPLPLPHETGMVEEYLKLLDGLILTGGAFDVPPSYYGEQDVHQKVTTKDQRSAFEMAMAKGALEHKIPVLGICGGEQLLNVALGGTLIQHIPDAVNGALEHEQKNDRAEAGHEVKVVEGTLLHKITGAKTLAVNTAHHQAVARPGANAVVNATTSDGVIEGIELPQDQHPFALGVQWHPEYHVSPGDRKIFEAFVAACRER